LRLLEIAQEKGSRIILALDAGLAQPSSLLHTVSDSVAGVKIGLPALLRWGVEEVKGLIREMGGSLYFLCDFKLADIPDIVADELRLISSLGFDGAIVHLFQGGVDRAAPEAPGLDVFGLVAMSHPESRLLDAHLHDLLEMAAEAKLAGLVVPATKPQVIREARRRFRDKVLVAPGVGAQGAEPGSALREGADLEIVGRAITMSADPASACKHIRERQLRALEGLGRG